VVPLDPVVCVLRRVVEHLGEEFVDDAQQRCRGPTSTLLRVVETLSDRAPPHQAQREIPVKVGSDR
jgi:hypothetical protein